MDPDAREDGAGDGSLLSELGITADDLPVVVTRTGRVLLDPDDAELDRALPPRR